MPYFKIALLSFEYYYLIPKSNICYQSWLVMNRLKADFSFHFSIEERLME